MLAIASDDAFIVTLVGVASVVAWDSPEPSGSVVAGIGTAFARSRAAEMKKSKVIRPYPDIMSCGDVISDTMCTTINKENFPTVAN